MTIQTTTSSSSVDETKTEANECKFAHVTVHLNMLITLAVHKPIVEFYV